MGRAWRRPSAHRPGAPGGDLDEACAQAGVEAVESLTTASVLTGDGVALHSERLGDARSEDEVGRFRAVAAQDDMEKPNIAFLPGILDPFYQVMEQGILKAGEDFGIQPFGEVTQRIIAKAAIDSQSPAAAGGAN